jgi:hypothetical protein
MKTFLLLAAGGLFCCSIALMAGCASSELVEVWSDSTFHGPALHRILVMSVSKNAVQRRIWEDAFSAGLARRDVAASASYREFPDAVPDTDKVERVVRSNNYDGVLVIRRLPTETTTQYLQGYMTKEQDMRYDRRRDKFVTYYRDIEHGGYVDSLKVDIRAIDVWTTENEGHMVWSATCETPEPNSAREVRPEIVKLVMSALTREGIIGPER